MEPPYPYSSFSYSGSFDSQAPLCEAAWKGDSLGVSHLAESESVNQTSSSGFSSLQYAAARGDLDVVRILVQAKAEVNQQDKEGWTCLMWAVWGRHYSVVQFLIHNGAAINLPNSNGDTCLHLACQSEDIKQEKYELIKNLILGGGCVNLQNLNGETPLHMAVATGDRDSIVLLLSYGAWINAQDYSGETPLHWAIREGSRSVIHTLIVSGADVNVQNDDMETPMHLACGCQGNWDIVEQLMSANAEIDPVDETGCTPLMEAISSGHSTIVRMLLRRGADVNHRDLGFRTPLHYAVEADGAGEMLGDLLAAGSDLNARDEEGRTPMEYVKSPKVLSILTRKLARISEKRRDINNFHHHNNQINDVMMISTPPSGSPVSDRREVLNVCNSPIV